VSVTFVSLGSLPECAAQLFGGSSHFVQLSRRTAEDWVDDLVHVLRGRKSAQHIGIAPEAMFDDVDPETIRLSLLPVPRHGAEDLVKLLAYGSFYYGPDLSLRQADRARDECVRDILRSVGAEAEFFTNHGHAENGDSADFFQAGFHYNSLAVTLYDVCLVAVSPDHLLVTWRFEDA
jgi:hypothetical protein